MEKDSIVNDLQWKKQYLMRRRESKEIDEDTYQKEFHELQEQINDRTRQLLEAYREKEKANAEKQKMEEHKMPEEVETKKIGRKPSANSTASIIAKALSQKGVKNLDDAVEKVCSEKEGLDKAKVKTQIKTIIREVKAGKGRWAAYDWNEENYLLTEKQ